MKSSSFLALSCFIVVFAAFGGSSDAAPVDARPADEGSIQVAESIAEPASTCSPDAIRCSQDRKSILLCSADGEWKNTPCDDGARCVEEENMVACLRRKN